MRKKDILKILSFTQFYVNRKIRYKKTYNMHQKETNKC